jgi:hypothetical protein
VTKPESESDVYGTASSTVSPEATIGRTLTVVILWVLAIAFSLGGVVAIVTH